MKGRLVMLTSVAVLATTVCSAQNLRAQETKLSTDSISIDTKLDEVIIQAYGESKRKSLTGSIERIGHEEIEMNHTTNFSSILEGTSGVLVYNSGGTAGGVGNVYIRGYSSINGSNTPLYIVDGSVFSGSLNDIDLLDIANISILKDASAAALYGNRAANGVILITTKNGRNTKNGIGITIRQGIYSRGIKEYSVLNADQFMEANWQGYRNSLYSGGKYSFDDAGVYATKNLIKTYLKYNIYNADDDKLFTADGKLQEGVKIKDGYKGDMDWFDDIIQNGYRQEYAMDYSNSDENSSQYYSISYLNENGYIKSTNFDRINGRANISFDKHKYITGGIGINVGYQSSNYVPLTNAVMANAMYAARQVAPIYPVHLHDMSTGEYILDANGNKIYDNGVDNNRPFGSNRNIVYENQNSRSNFKRGYIFARPYLDVHILPELTFSVAGQFFFSDEKTKVRYNSEIGDGAYNGKIYSYNSNNTNYTVSEQLKWRHSFNRHSFNVLLGHESYSYIYDRDYSAKEDETLPNNNNLSNYATIKALTESESKITTESYLGRLQYNFDERYFVEGSYRRDGSSRFEKSNRWGNFGSIGASWLISSEEFFKDVNYVDYLKLRASYGVLGNDKSVSPYMYDTQFALSTSNQLGATYKISNATKDLKWESVEMFDVALETNLWQRLGLSLEFFNKKSRNLIFYENKPLSGGLTTSEIFENTVTQAINMGSVVNKGVELNIDAKVIKGKDWTWTVGTSLNVLKNEVTKLPKENRESGLLSNNKKIFEGRSMYEWWLPQYVGVDQATGRSLYELNTDDYYVDPEMASSDKTAIPTSAKANIVKINDEYYTYDPTTAYVKYNYSGCAIPKFYGSVYTDLTWKTLTLSVRGSFNSGNKIYDAAYQNLMQVTGSSIHSLHSDANNSWRPENAVAEDAPNRINRNGIPMINYDLSSQNNANSSRFISKGNCFVLNKLSLKYKFPKQIINKIDLSELSVLCTIENLFTTSSRQGMNPRYEVEGVTGYGTVTPRIISFGLTVKL